jgi:hypothetical protein
MSKRGGVLQAGGLEEEFSFLKKRSKKRLPALTRTPRMNIRQRAEVFRFFFQKRRRSLNGG